MSAPPSAEPGRGAQEKDAWTLEAARLVAPCRDDALCMEIGLRAEALRLDPGSGSGWSWPGGAPEHDPAAAFPGLQALGERLVHRLEGHIAELIVGAEDIDDLDRRRLLAAAHLSQEDAIAEIAAALVAAFGLAPPIAPLVAAVLHHRGVPAAWHDLPRAPRVGTLFVGHRRSVSSESADENDGQGDI